MTGGSGRRNQPPPVATDLVECIVIVVPDPGPGEGFHPSGHSASAFAFATAVGVQLSIVAFPLRALAAAVAYSRVHIGSTIRVTPWPVH